MCYVYNQWYDISCAILYKHCVGKNLVYLEVLHLVTTECSGKPFLISVQSALTEHVNKLTRSKFHM